MSFLARIKEKPSSVKSNIALGGAAVITLVITVVWVTTLPARFGTISESVGSLKKLDETASVQNGFSDLVGGVKAQEGTLKESGAPNGDVTNAFENTETEALNSLSNWNTEQQPGGTLSATGSIGIPSIPEPEAPVVTTATATPEISPEPAPVPKVILIGTTTKKAP